MVSKIRARMVDQIAANRNCRQEELHAEIAAGGEVVNEECVRQSTRRTPAPAGRRGPERSHP